MEFHSLGSSCYLNRRHKQKRKINLMITVKHTQGFIAGILSTIVFALLVAGNTLQSDPNLERRVTTLEERVTKLEQSNSIEDESRPSNSKSVNNWRRLENGMTMSQVRNLLGEPNRVSSTGSIVDWHYGSSSISSTVTFHNGKVYGWNEPN